MYFIRWAGGKQSIIKKIIEFLPKDYKNMRIIEPFAGAASLFFNTNAKKYILIDSNNNLINCYKQIKKSPIAVSKYLDILKRKHSRKSYYKVRDAYNIDMGFYSIQQAARFIYLVQSSFNGIYRVNIKGEYNVPFGKEKPSFPSLEMLVKISKRLRLARLYANDFKIVKKLSKENDFIYFDPPYVAINQTSYFQHYTKTRFSNDEQIIVSNIAKELSSKKIKILLSNSDTKFIRGLFKNWNIHQIDVVRYISCKKKKRKVKEILISNY
jgi:DNA adenine methylase